MAPVIIGCWLSAMLLLPFPAPPSDLHVVFEYQFNYMSMKRATTTEMWTAPGRSAARVGDRLTIDREDLGVRWRVDVKAGTYVEDKISTAPSAPPVKREDIHTVGYDYYEPDYEWTVREVGSSMTSGRPCRDFVGAGDADYAEATVKFSLCQPIEGATFTNDAIVTQLRSESARKMIANAAVGQKAWVLKVEETQEPAVAGTIVVTIAIKTLETMPAPPGTFDLPANVKKAGR